MYKSIGFLVLVVLTYAEGAVWGLCALELARINKQIEDMTTANGFPPIGTLKPTCLPDGTYDLKQCLGGICRCVGSDGEILTGDIERGLAYDMQCKCARALADYKKKGIVGRFYDCDNLGNYRSKQCLGSRCFCVEYISGKPVGENSVHIAEKHLLNC